MRGKYLNSVLMISGWMTAAAVLILFGSGCASYFPPLRTTKARLGAPTEVNKDLVSLPQPKEKVYVAVYKFRDQTGQYKASSTGTSWSTAVTQGATSILLRALGESNWFIPIEREGLSDLLNERKIIRSSRANYQGKVEDENALIPPLLFAGVILEGGIISYDTNILTGGAGVQYFGLGGSGQYREDRVSIYLRATSTQNGRILKTVYTTKTILSQMVDVNFFRFVKFKRMLEAETGFSYNEPTELCITEAIEKAVQSLIVEGIIEGLWELKDKKDLEAPSIKEYLQEKQEISNSDYFGREVMKEKGYGLGLNIGGQIYSGDYPGSKTTLSGQFSMRMPFYDNMAFTMNLSSGQISDDKFFKTDISSIELQSIYFMNPQSRLTPMLFAGAGISYIRPRDRYGNLINLRNKWTPSVSAGAGLEYMVSQLFAINSSIDCHYLLSDYLDGKKGGSINDYFWGAQIGLVFYPWR